MLITEFDPWKSQLCTCPNKLTFNPYTGCDHRCLYCYASSYIPRFYECRAKKDLISRLKREAAKLGGELISISNSSDPYPRLERKEGLMRKCLEILAKSDCRIQIVTKSDLVTRDIDILKNIPSMVSVSLTTVNDELSKKLEPHAPLSSKRIDAIETLVKNDIPTTVRIDPIIPFLNDDVGELVKLLARRGVLQITSSTYKIKPANWRRFGKAFPNVSSQLNRLYFDEGEKIGRAYYLPRKVRFDLMKKVKELTEGYGMRFGCCREGFNLNSARCDGSWVVTPTRA
jgi:DNA repair photolyase